jgi:O-antigen ligase
VPSEWSFRLPLYKAAVSIFRDYPVFGAGIGMYEKVLHTPKYELSKDYPVSKELNLHAHNTYLEVASEMGTVGFSAFIGIFLTFFIKALKKIPVLNKEAGSEDKKAIYFGLMGTISTILIFAFSTTIITVGVNNSLYFWLLFGMATAMFLK